MLDLTRRLPFWLYRIATPLRLQPEQAVVAQLPGLGVDRGSVVRILISHFHADHLAGLRDFPDATFVAHDDAVASIAGLDGLRALRRGFIPGLLPHDFYDRLVTFDQFCGPVLPGLGPTHDLYGDGSMLLMPLPGHARGQIGLLAHTERGDLLLAADGCWLSRSVRERRPPSVITHLFVDDSEAVMATLDRLHTFLKARPDVRLVPTHCPEALRREVTS
jgi:glyoxylase-like metal-dependent hydrolase (beta-lactamase superfamily II)